MKMKRSLIIAHRGASGEAPENTLAAFKLAVDQGCDGIELDIHLSQDQQIVVCHDESLDRTTTGSGLIRDLNVEDIRNYDAGSWFSPAFSNEKIPLLTEVLEVIPKHIMLNIEVKNIPFSYQGIELKLIELLKAYERLDYVVISSFDHQLIKQIKLIEPEAKVAPIYFAKLVREYTKLISPNVFSIHPSFYSITSEEVDYLQKQGYLVFPWTVNDECELERVIELGVDGIITDFPGRMKKVLDEIEATMKGVL